MFQIRINKELCIGCGYCTTLCPYKCFELRERAPDDRRADLASCHAACPMHNDIRGAIACYVQGEGSEASLTRAWRILSETNPMPAVVGRVCPNPCEAECHRQFLEGATNAGALERFVGDHGLRAGLRLSLLTSSSRAEKVAIIGSGPAGISCAYQLRRRGYPVTIFEAQPDAGGMLRYGIPQYRLPRQVLDAEIRRVLELGVELQTNITIGQHVQLEELERDFQAIFVGIGCQAARRLNVPGEDASNVISGIELLGRVNRGDPVEVAGQVIVIGGGNVAIDAARVCWRRGAESVSLFCLESRKEMPAIQHEIEEALAEGVRLHDRYGVRRFLTQENQAQTVELVRCTSVGKEDGRYCPRFDESQLLSCPVSLVVVAAGQEPCVEGYAGKMRNLAEWMRVDDSCKTGIARVFAGGDATRLGLVAEAIGQGHRAALTIDAELKGTQPSPSQGAVGLLERRGSQFAWTKPRRRAEQRVLPAKERGFDPGNSSEEINRGIPDEIMLDTAKRCFSCGTAHAVVTKEPAEDCVACRSCQIRCAAFAIDILEEGSICPQISG